MSHNTGDAPTKPEGYDWDDPHGFHEGTPIDEEGHHHEEHHVSSWQLNVVILFALLFFTLLTVIVAKGEVFLTTYTDIPITQLWNVIIAMAIATVKAMLVCMYFMHLRHDKALNTMVMLFTFATLGMFMTMPAIDVGSRGAIKDYALGEVVEGGSGVGMSRPNGEDISGSVVVQSREKKIAEVGEEKFWETFYKKKADYKHHVHRHPADEKDYFAKWVAKGSQSYKDYKADVVAEIPEPEVSSANRQVIRTGLTPGLFDAEAPKPKAVHDDDHSDDGHSDDDHSGDNHAEDPDDSGESHDDDHATDHASEDED